MRVPGSVPKVPLLALVSCLGGVVLPSCADPQGARTEPSEGAPNRNAVIAATLVNVPGDALCLELSLSSSAIPSDTWTKLFSITPGTSPTVEMDGLPPGAATLTARTFGLPCTQVQAGTPITWIVALPVSLNLVAGQTVSASIVLRRPGSVQVTATFDDGSLTLAPADHDFGNVAPGASSAPFIFTFTNGGQAPVDFALPPNASLAPFYVDMATSTCLLGTTLPAMSSCQLVVIFVGQTSGGGTVTKDLNVSTSLGTVTATLTGTTATGNLMLTPSSLGFGNVVVGASANLTLTVSNPSAATAALPPAAISGTDAALFATAPGGPAPCAATLAPLGNCTMLVSFTAPMAGTAGAKTASLSLGGATVSLGGIVVITGLAITPSTVDFGSVTVGTVASATLTVTNIATSPEFVPAPSLLGPDNTQFTTSAGGPSPCPSTLAAGASCTLLASFAPTSAGSKTSGVSLVFTSASLTGTGVALTPVYRINCGSSSAVSPFTADQYASGGTQHTVTNTINLSGVTDPAPEAVYRSERYGNSTYTFPGLTASATYTVRLHFAEIYWTATGRRRFNVTINGTSVLSNFDIYATAGGNYRAVVREFTTTANASGQIVVTFTTVTDNASIGGIEIIR
jgi:hypothetical protein